MKVSILGLEFTVDPALPWANDLLSVLSDVTRQSPWAGPLHGSLAIEADQPRQLRGVVEEIESELARTGDTLLDRRYRTQLQFPSHDRIVLHTAHSCPEWFSWCLQVSALRSGATFVHAAGLERDGAGLLLAARNGFGKTALIGEFVRRRGWRLLGDDLTLLTADGTCFGYPRALVLHPEHRSFFPEVFARGAGPKAPAALSHVIEDLSRWVKPLLRKVPGLLEHARRHHPQAVRISPSRVFGADQIAARAQLQTMLWLERRAELTRPLLRPAADTMPARAFGSTIDEFDPWCVRITNVALAMGLLRLDETYGTWNDVLHSGLRGVHAYTLYLPASVPMERMPDLVFDTLSAEGIIARPEVASCT